MIYPLFNNVNGINANCSQQKIKQNNEKTSYRLLQGYSKNKATQKRKKPRNLELNLKVICEFFQ